MANKWGLKRRVEPLSRDKGTDQMCTDVGERGERSCKEEEKSSWKKDEDFKENKKISSAFSEQISLLRRDSLS